MARVTRSVTVPERTLCFANSARLASGLAECHRGAGQCCVVASTVKPGDVLVGRYRIERVLGEGGMGVVLAAEHLMLGERVAVKLLLPEAAQIPEVVPRFQREARAAAKIQSEHVARVMDVGALEDGRPYLVMEYLEGRDLAAELEARGPLPIEEAVEYVLQAGVGVAAAHALGIVHRDLKPSNLFLARLPNNRSLVKVLDFGIAKHTDARSADITSTFSALGSAAYMSPEQLRMAKSVDARTDVWAFGVVLFELLTGRMPFEGESVTAVAAAIAVDPPQSLRAMRPDVPVELEEIIFCCLEKNREERTPSVHALASALSPFGGRFANVLAARIAEILRPDDRPSEPGSTSRSLETGAPSPGSAAGAPAIMPAQHAPAAHKEVGTTRPAWTTTPGSSARPRIGTRAALAGVAGAALIGGGVLMWRVLGSSPEDVPLPPAGLSSVDTVKPTASPAPAATLPVSPLAGPRPQTRPVQAESATSTSTTTGVSPPAPTLPSESHAAPSPSANPRPQGSKPSGPKPAKRKKPLVTDL